MANETRDVFFNKIFELMEQDRSIFIISVDLAGRPFDLIRKKHPERYIAIGIAEQNAISTACGLASTGKKVIVYAANPFPLLRAFDQIRNCACMMNIPITIVGLGTGFSVASCGSTHFTIEDITLGTICSGLKVLSVSDSNMAGFFANHFVDFNCPLYIRFGKWAGENFGSFCQNDFERGFRVVRKGKNTVIVATGCTVKYVFDMSIKDVAVIDWFNITNTKHILEELVGYKQVIVVEEHILRGGLGSILLELYHDKRLDSSMLYRVGIRLDSGYPQEYGDREYWLDKFGITKLKIEGLIKELK